MSTKSQTIRRRQRHVEWMNEKKNVPCYRCGVKYPPFVMDWHHREREQKELSIGRSLHRSLKIIEKEIQKCDLYCANCHRIIDYQGNYHARMVQEV